MRQPRILWASPSHLLDSTSGASKAIRTILKQLHKSGWGVMAISGTVFDDPAGAKVVNDSINGREEKPGYWDVRDEFMVHRTIPMSTTYRLSVTATCELNYYEHFITTLEQFRPDIIFLFGGYPLELLICHEAKLRKIPIAFYLGNSFYLKGAVVFGLVDLVITDSEKTAAIYREKLKLQAIPVGAFIDPDEVIADRYDRKYITFINPELSKGATLFAALALHYKDKNPKQRFLVVQSRGKWIESLIEAGYNPEDFTNVDVAENIPNVKLIYKVTKILLAPSLAYESAGRVLIEAQMNSIPVIGSNIGGIPEMIGDGGVVLDPPESAVNDHKVKLQSEDILRWINVVEDLLENEDQYQSLSLVAKNSANTRHDISIRTKNLIALLKPLSDQKAGDRPFAHPR